MNLVLDTETSGLFDFSKPADAPGQPRLASFAAIVVTPDLALEEEYHRLIKPDGWVIDPQAAAVNGLTPERLEAEGVPVREVLDWYAEKLDAGRVVIAFNAQFDTKIMRAELRLAGMDDRFTKTPNICVMRPCTDIVKAPKKSGKGYKFPNLSETMAYFGLPETGAHTALGDARNALDIKNRPGEQPPTP